MWEFIKGNTFGAVAFISYSRSGCRSGTWPSARMTGVSGFTTLGGYLGLITALLAWYTSLAGVLNAVSGRVALTTFPRS